MKKRWLAIILSIGLAIPPAPVTALAQETAQIVTEQETSDPQEEKQDTVEEAVGELKAETEETEVLQPADPEEIQLPETDVPAEEEETEAMEETTEIAVISGFAAQENPMDLRFFSGKRPTQEEVQATMPAVLKVQLQDGTWEEIPVTWESEGGDLASTEFYYYQFSPRWDETKYRLAEGLDRLQDAPYIGVYYDPEEISTMSVTGNPNETEIYNYLRGEMGLNSAAACGVLANIYCESSFNPNALGDKGTSYGICQWHNTRWDNLKEYCRNNGYSYKTLEGQLHFLQYELSSNSYYKKTYNYLKSVADTAQGAYDAAWYWCYYFEIPADKANVAVTRGNLAKNKYWKEYGGNPTGRLDEVKPAENEDGAFKVRGWAFDEDDYSAALTLDVYLGGAKGSSGAEFCGVLTADQERADVAGAYPAAGSMHGFSGIFRTEKTGAQKVYVYAHNVGKGEDTVLPGSGKTVQIPAEPPKILRADVIEADESGYTLEVEVTDNEAVAGLRFSTCREGSGDWKKEEIAIPVEEQGPDVVQKYRINIADFGGQSGEYWTDIYAYDVKNNISECKSVQNYVDLESPVISNVRVTKVTADGYTVICSVKDDGVIDRVQFPTWQEEAGEESLPEDWETDARFSGTIDEDEVCFRVQDSDFQYVRGSFRTRICAWDQAGHKTEYLLDSVELSNKEVPKKTVYDQKTGHAYELYDDVLTWEEAKSRCESMGGHLAVITSSEENQLAETLLEASARSRVFLGGMLESGTWKWVDNGSWSYEDWKNGEPSAEAGKNRLVLMRDGGWSAAEADAAGSGYICEYEIAENEVSLWKCTAALAEEDFIYDGTEKCPAAVVKDGKRQLQEGTEYQLEYSDNTLPGTGKVIITGLAPYAGRLEKTFSIRKKPVFLQVAETAQAYGRHVGDPAFALEGITYGGDAQLQYLVTDSRDASGGETAEDAVVTVTEEGMVNIVGAGTAQIEVRAPETRYCQAGEPQTIAVRVLEAEEEEAFWVQPVADQIYTGKALKPKVIVWNGTNRMILGKDYTVSYSYNTNVNGEGAKNRPTVTVSGKGNYTGKQKVYFNILPRNLWSEGMQIPNMTTAYNGSAQKKTPTVTDNGKKLQNDKDYTVEFTGSEGAGGTGFKQVDVYTITVVGKGNYTGKRQIKLTIAQKSQMIGQCSVSKISSKAYRGSAIVLGEDELRVTYGSGSSRKTLVPEKDYHVVYKNNRNIGTASATIMGIGSYVGSKTVTFKITGNAFSRAKVQGICNAVYDGVPKEQESMTVTYVNSSKKTVTLEEGRDYTVSYSNNVNVGTAQMVLTGKGAYAGTIKKTFRILAYDMKKDSEKQLQAMLAGEVSGGEPAVVPYEKDGAKPAVSVTYAGTLLKEGKDYKISYKDSGSITTESTKRMPTAVISGKGNFKGSISLQFKVEQQQLREPCIQVPDIAASASAGKYRSTPVLTDDRNGRKLKSGKDYTVEGYYKEDGTPLTAADVVPAGTTLKVRVVGKGCYTGKLEAAYCTAAAAFSDAVVKVLRTPVYTGKEIRLTGEDLRVTYNGVILEEHTDYEIKEDSYEKNLAAGTASVVLKGLGEYAGNKTVKFKINRNNL